MVNEPHFDFDIPRQRAALALTVFAEQANLTLIVPHELLEGKISNELIGRYSLQEGIDILLDGTGLEPVISNHVVLSITAEAPADPGDTMKAKQKVGLLAVLASLFASGATAQTPNDASPGEQEPVPLEEIIVTGTNIRGQGEGASPVFVYDRDEIERAGFSTVQELIQSIPQNFNGGASEDTSLGAEGGGNDSGGVGVNLRGLGTDSTLVLFNGRRTAQGGGSGGDFVDISSLPLNAIERIEVLTDGASALYGSDAIAGVVNFILRDNYEGAETRIRHGSVTNGDLDEVVFGQAFGKTWSGGNVLLTYEYYDRENLSSADRAYTANSDLTPFGGSNFGDPLSNPGNITGEVSAAIPPGQDGLALTPEELLVGEVNLRNTREGLDLLQSQRRHSVFLTANHRITGGIKVFGEFRLTDRAFESDQGGETRTLLVPDSNPFFVSPTPGATSVELEYNLIDDLGPMRQDGDVETIGSVVGINFDLSDTWRVEVYGLYSEESTERTLSNRVIDSRLSEALGTDDPATTFDPAIDGHFNPFGDGSNTAQSVIEFVRGGFSGTSGTASLWAISGKADGELFEAPGGAAQLAIGMEYREEAFESQLLNGTADETPFVDEFFTSDLSRDVVAAFTEVFFPVVGERNAIPGIRRLDLSIAGRYEEYSDFGSSADPKIGVIWSPIDDLFFRGTWGTSFKAPKLTSFEGLAVDLAAPFIIDPNSGGFVTAILRQGANPDLSSEESEAWTFGARFAPSAVQGLTIDITYYDIEFEDRIARPGNVFTFLFDPEFFAAVITEDPSEASVQAIFDGPAFFPLFGPPPPASQVEFILDGRINNIAVTETSGIDLTASYGFGSGIGDFDFEFSSNYILKFDEALISTAGLTDLVDTINNPTELRLRGSATWSRNAFSTSVYINHTGSYLDNLSDPGRRIGSYTTVDLSMRYDLAQNTRSILLSGLEAQLAISNLLDEDPPFANNPAGVAYDPENADPRGRFIALQLTKQW